MTEDVIRSLGYLTLGTRLRRLGERLQADTQRILDDRGLDVQAAHYPFLATIDRLGPSTIGELADAVGVSQPAATRSVNLLSGSGFVGISADREDLRCKRVRLTSRGQALVETGKRDVWPEIEGGVRELCARLSGPLLEQLAALEDGLTELPLAKRVAKRRARGAGR